MEAKRYIGIDLHRERFTCCTRLESGREYVSEWKLERLGQFVNKLRPADEVAVEVTGNTRLFHDAVAPAVARVHGLLVLRVLLRQRLVEELAERDGEAPEGVEWLRHQINTTRKAVARALIVATGSSTFQPRRINWS